MAHSPYRRHGYFPQRQAKLLPWVTKCRLQLIPSENGSYSATRAKALSLLTEKHQAVKDVAAVLKRIRIHPEAQRILGNSDIPVVSLERLNFRAVFLSSSLQPVVSLVRLPCPLPSKLCCDTSGSDRQNGFSQETSPKPSESSVPDPVTTSWTEPCCPDGSTSEEPELDSSFDCDFSPDQPYILLDSESDEWDPDGRTDLETIYLDPDPEQTVVIQLDPELKADQDAEDETGVKCEMDIVQDAEDEAGVKCQMGIVQDVEYETGVKCQMGIVQDAEYETEVKCQMDIVQDAEDETGVKCQMGIVQEDDSEDHRLEGVDSFICQHKPGPGAEEVDGPGSVELAGPQPEEVDAVEVDGPEPEEMESDDFCAVCENGGDLLCCDRCPKVYHLACHVPPLTSFPLGDWKCTLCRTDQEPMNAYDCEKVHSWGSVKAAYTLSHQDQRRCEKLTLLLYCHAMSAPFHEPVSPLARNYYQIIKRPINLSLIRRKLDKSNTLHYFTVEQFIDDVLLMFRNCATFNYPDSEVAKAGRNLELFFLNQLKEVFPDQTFPSASQDTIDRARLRWLGRKKKEICRKRRYPLRGEKYVL